MLNLNNLQNSRNYFVVDIIHPPPMYDFPFPSAANLKRLPAVTPADTNHSISFSKLSIDKLERLEDNLRDSGIVAYLGSTARGLAIQGYPSGDALHYDKSSLTVTKASQDLVWRKCKR